MIKVKFKGIDGWNRPVFKDIENNKYYGNTMVLFSWGATEKEVLKKITAEHLEYFGNRFDCEPMGTLPTDKIEILTK